MTDRPILFSGPMVRALLDGQKTQTRRVLNPQPNMLNGGHPLNDGRGSYSTDAGWKRYRPDVGDRLYVREAFSGPHGCRRLPPRDWPVGAPIWRWADGDPVDGDWTMPKPGIHMPRWASRMTLVVTEVRVQRLQDITEEDAIAEGATSRPDCSGFLGRDLGWSMDWSRVGTPSRFARNGQTLSERDVSLGSARTAFAGFLNELHDPRWNIKGDGIFGENPWCSALTFTVHHQNIDAPGAKEAA